MKSISYLLLSLCITAFVYSSIFAQQNRWLFVGEDVDGVKFYLDKNSRQETGSSIRVWNKSVYPDGSYRISQVEWKCNEKKYFITDVSIYSSTGSFIGKDRGTTWLNVIPDSMSEGMYKAVCLTSSNKNSERTVSSNKAVEIIVRKANLRAGPNTNSRITQRAILGEQFILIEEESTNGWYQVIIVKTNQKAWVHGNNIKMIEMIGKPNIKKRKAK